MTTARRVVQSTACWIVTVGVLTGELLYVHNQLLPLSESPPKSLAEVSEPGRTATISSAAAEPVKEESKAANRKRGKAGNFQSQFVAALSKPEFLQLLKERQKLLIDHRYKNLFDHLKLDDKSLNAFKDLLVEKQLAMSDAQSVAKSLGVVLNKDERTLAVLDAQKDVEAQISSLLGEQGYPLYQHFEATSAIRATVERLQLSLSYTSTPLSNDQVEELVETLYDAGAKSRKVKQGDATGIAAQAGAGFGDASDNMARIPDIGLRRARPILLPAQVTALQHLMAVQQAPEQLKKLSRQTREQASLR